MKTEIKTITPEIAREFLRKNTRNRPLNVGTVNFYERQMRNGLWKENGQSIGLSINNNLLDGQHRLTALINTNKSYKFVVVSELEEDVFDTIDQGKIRSFGDILSIDNVKNAVTIAAIIGKYTSLNNSKFLATDTQAKTLKISKQECLNEYKTTPELYQEIYRVSHKCYKYLHLFPDSEAGAYMTYLIKNLNYDKEYVFGFFEKLFIGENLDNKSIIRVLRDTLLKSNINGNKITQKHKRALIIKAWNMYVEERTCKRLIFSEIEEYPKFK